MALYHRCHYNSSGRLFDVRLGTDGSAVCDGPNPAQWTGASWNRGAPLGGERERAFIAFFTLISRKHTDSPPKAHGESCPCGESVLVRNQMRRLIAARTQLSAFLCSGDEILIIAAAIGAHLPQRFEESLWQADDALLATLPRTIFISPPLSVA
jgi:hypothetical protein